MMVSLFGSFHQFLHTAFLIRYIILQPALLELKANLYPLLEVVLSLLPPLD